MNLLSIYLSIYLPVCFSVRSPVCSSIHPPNHPTIHPSIYIDSWFYFVAPSVMCPAANHNMLDREPFHKVTKEELKGMRKK